MNKRDLPYSLLTVCQFFFKSSNRGRCRITYGSKKDSVEKYEEVKNI